MLRGFPETIDSIQDAAVKHGLQMEDKRSEEIKLLSILFYVWALFIIRHTVAEWINNKLITSNSAVFPV